MAPIFESAPPDPLASGDLLGSRAEILATILMQSAARRWASRRKCTAATRLQSHARARADRLHVLPRARADHRQRQAARTIQRRHRQRADERRAGIFVVRNLDTGETVEVTLDDEGGSTPGAQRASASSAVLGTVQRGSHEWAALLEEARGVLEKLASSKMFTVRRRQLCIWQERYIYATDDALCYQHVTNDMQPFGKSKHIPYSSIEFVGAFDEAQFVVKTAKRSYTFLCDSMETRTQWIKNISMLTGCSSSLEVCFKTVHVA